MISTRSVTPATFPRCSRISWHVVRGIAEAAHKLLYLMREAHRRKLSGFSLKDEAETLALESAESSAGGNFLIEGDTTPDQTMQEQADRPQGSSLTGA